MRRAGVLLHPTSLPGPDGIGDLGGEAHRFAAWLARCGFRAWQMLPIGPVGPGDSPYSSLSSFAGEPLLLSLDALVLEGWLARDRVAEARARAEDGRNAPSHRRLAAGRHAGGSRKGAGRKPLTTDERGTWAAARRLKEPLLQEAYEGFLRRGAARGRDYRRFVSASAWLPGWCAFEAGAGRAPGFAAFLQFAFDRQWTELRRACSALNLELIGDLPIFVAPDSADVAAHPELFRLDRRGRPEVVTGVPPDCFSRDGQRWGHPHYHWPAHRREGFRWWRARVETALKRFDLLRIDHFVGFVHAFEIPARNRTARQGRWRAAPGRELLSSLRRSLGRLPFIAEDLGAVTPAVVSLREEFNLPGMRLLQNAFGAPDSPDLPHRHPRHCAVYPGTHDNDTTLGWWRSLEPADRSRFLHYAGGTPEEVVRSMIRLACTSPADLCIIPMQDLLGLGSEARMNRPGCASGQWSWRLPGGWSGRIDSGWIRATLEASARCVAQSMTAPRFRGDGPGAARPLRAPGRGRGKGARRA